MKEEIVAGSLKFLSRKLIAGGAAGYGIYLLATAAIAPPIALAGIIALAGLGGAYLLGQSYVDGKIGKSEDSDPPPEEKPAVPKVNQGDPGFTLMDALLVLFGLLLASLIYFSSTGCQCLTPGLHLPADAPVVQDSLTTPAAPDAAPIRPSSTSPTAELDTHVWLPVYFDFDSAVIRESERGKILSHGDLLARFRDKRLTLIGHADPRGSGDYNIALSDRRANAVKQYLSDLGLASSRIETLAVGEELPVCEEHNEECWALCRRVEFEVR